MDYDDEEDEEEEEERLDLRKILSDEEYRAFNADEPEVEDELPDITMYRKTPFGEIPIASSKGDLSEGISIGEFGMGKLLVLTGLALIALGVSMELHDRMSRKDREEEDV